MEHILRSNIMTHLDANSILDDAQHGFRSKRSCENQLLLFDKDIKDAMDNKIQVDAIFLDFAKAFDKVPHHRLAIKLETTAFVEIPCAG